MEEGIILGEFSFRITRGNSFWLEEAGVCFTNL
jgi:hypothetical protein